MLFAVIIAIAAVVIIGASAFVLLRDRGDVLVLDDHAPTVLDAPAPADGAIVVDDAPEAVIEDAPTPSFRERLSTARSALGGYLGSVFSGGKISGETWDDLEEALIRADVGVTTSSSIIDAVREQVAEADIEDTAELPALVKAEIVARLDGFDRSLSADTVAAGGEPGPAVWLFVGVNGVGKTTTIGKLAHRETNDGKKLVLAAGDTFRAAAAEQLTMWAERSGVDIVRGAEGADPSSVVFDAVEAAGARHADIVMADTAGRLQTKTNLMEELSKVRRVAEKGVGTVTETLLVIDATTGQNGMSQAQQFAETADVTGVVLTKLDGSAKGGIVIAIHSELGVPVKLVGLGESINDLVDFDATEFVDALFE
ncbi:MAG: signal recognition particle-docking protein FtsY [Acidimicrobiales bacterium]|jgi:fused signal recognition particle receptor|nr:signal recognition particle-docking protein FtsY [Acidimicrobiales bacterium]